jgi:hypothetical protein
MQHLSREVAAGWMKNDKAFDAHLGVEYKYVPTEWESAIRI